MTAAEYRSALTTLRLTQERAARLLGIHPVTSHRWATGENDVNETAARFLRFLIAANISASTAVSILRIAMPRSKLHRLKRHEARTEKVGALSPDANLDYGPRDPTPREQMVGGLLQHGTKVAGARERRPGAGTALGPSTS